MISTPWPSSSGSSHRRQLVDARPCRLGAPSDGQRISVTHLARRRAEVVEMAVRDEHHVASSRHPRRLRGEVGLPNHGSNSTTMPPGVRQVNARMAEPGEIACRSWRSPPPFRSQPAYGRCCAQSVQPPAFRVVAGRRFAALLPMSKMSSFWRAMFRLQYRLLAWFDGPIRARCGGAQASATSSNSPSPAVMATVSGRGCSACSMPTAMYLGHPNVTRVGRATSRPRAVARCATQTERSGISYRACGCQRRRTRGSDQGHMAASVSGQCRLLNRSRPRPRFGRVLPARVAA